MDCHLYFNYAFGPFPTTPYFNYAPSLWVIPSDSPAQNQQGTPNPTIAAGGFTRKTLRRVINLNGMRVVSTGTSNLI